jgi:polysaccharide export outer membrane protein
VCEELLFRATPGGVEFVLTEKYSNDKNFLGPQYDSGNEPMTQSATNHFLAQCPPKPECLKVLEGRRASVPLLSFLLFMMLVPALFAQTAERAEPPAAPLYVIQPNDLLRIFVWKQTDMSGQVLVRPDGRISLPLVQDIQAAGRTPAELKQKIEESLKEYLEFPTVTVIVDAIQSYRVFVTGQVTKPGPIMSEKPITVLQAIALAGGFLPVAKPAETVVVRSTSEGSTLFRFNYPEVIKGEHFNQNIMLKTGDVVVVP